MIKEQTIQLFEEKNVRMVWDGEQEKWFFCVVEALTEIKDHQGYIKKMKQRNLELNIDQVILNDQRLGYSEI